MTTTYRRISMFDTTVIKPLIRISLVSWLAGDIPSKVKKLVVEWANLHQAELLENWELATKNKLLKTIEPLE